MGTPAQKHQILIVAYGDERTYEEAEILIGQLSRSRATVRVILDIDSLALGTLIEIGEDLRQRIRLRGLSDIFQSEKAESPTTETQ